MKPNLGKCHHLLIIHRVAICLKHFCLSQVLSSHVFAMTFLFGMIETNVLNIANKTMGNNM